MKKSIYSLMVPLMIAASSVLNAQDYAEARLGLPGDNLNLFAVMKLFQESETLEGFERKLNDENSRINNLDLNGDNYIDYIRVIDQPDGDAHIIVLQVAINARENQDVAVFYVQREANNQVSIQLVGDEALYGKNYIIEPNYDGNGRYANETPNPGYTGRTRVVEGQTIVVNRVTTYEVATWPLIRFMFLPTYIVWHSPWYWGYYPSYWRPWTPFYWHHYYGYHYHWYPHYYGYYRHYHDYRYPTYHNHYYGSRRAYSPYVSNNISRGTYKTTYSRPETRKEGSNLYTRTYASGNRRDVGTSSRDRQVSKSTTSQGGSAASGRRAAPARSTEATTGRSTSTRSTEATTGRSTSTRSTEATTGRSKSTRSTETTTSRGTSTRSSEATTGRKAPQQQATSNRQPAQRQSSGETVKSNHSSSRRSSGDASVKSTSKSSGSGRSEKSSGRTSSGRR